MTKFLGEVGVAVRVWSELFLNSRRHLMYFLR